MLHGRGILDKPGLLWSAAGIMFIYWHRHGFGQEPERNSRHQGDGTSDEVAQPPCSHPAGISRSNSHSLCEVIRTLSVQSVNSFIFLEHIHFKVKENVFI